MQTRDFAGRRPRSFTMLLAIPAAAGLLTWAGAVGPATASATTRTASGVAAAAATRPSSPTAVMLSASRTVSVSR